MSTDAEWWEQNGSLVRRSRLMDDVVAAEEDLQRARDALAAYDASDAERRYATRRLHALFKDAWAPGMPANRLRAIEKQTL